jgi:hypothetical protein
LSFAGVMAKNVQPWTTMGKQDDTVSSNLSSCAICKDRFFHQGGKMPVSGLVVTLRSERQEMALDAIRSHAAFSPGRLSGQWLPVAMEARDDADSRNLHDWLLSLPGVAFVDVVAVNFDDTATEKGAQTKFNNAEP